jgi:hypothetical protein
MPRKPGGISTNRLAMGSPTEVTQFLALAVGRLGVALRTPRRLPKDPPNPPFCDAPKPLLAPTPARWPLLLLGLALARGTQLTSSTRAEVLHVQSRNRRDAPDEPLSEPINNLHLQLTARCLLLTTTKRIAEAFVLTACTAIAPRLEGQRAETVTPTVAVTSVKLASPSADCSIVADASAPASARPSVKPIVDTLRSDQVVVAVHRHTKRPRFRVRCAPSCQWFAHASSLRDFALNGSLGALQLKRFRGEERRTLGRLARVCPMGNIRLLLCVD